MSMCIGKAPHQKVSNKRWKITHLFQVMKKHSESQALQLDGRRADNRIGNYKILQRVRQCLLGAVFDMSSPSVVEGKCFSTMFMDLSNLVD
jgi:hypothetical protein